MPEVPGWILNGDLQFSFCSQEKIKFGKTETCVDDVGYYTNLKQMTKESLVLV